MTTLYIARHGETEWNVAGRIMGRHDSPLTPRGVTQAKALARQLAGIPLTAIYSSPAGRAFTTASLVAETLGIATPTVIEDLQERSYGSFEAQPGNVYKQALDAWLTTQGDTPELDASIAPDVETKQGLLRRIKPALKQIAEKHPEESILLVSHGAVLRTFLGSLKGVAKQWLEPGGLPNASYIVLTYAPETGFMFNSIHEVDATHLPEQV